MPDRQIVISKRKLKQTLFWVVFPIALILIGMAVTPLDANGTPLFLSPRVAQVTKYQRTVQEWVDRMDALQGQMTAVLEDKNPDLYEQDRLIQDIIGQTQSLTSEIDSTVTPDTLESLRDLMLYAAQTYEDAAVAVAAWASTPTTELLQAAYDALDTSAAALKSIHNNPWITASTETP